MIKGFQIQDEKYGGMTLVLHKELIRPDGLDTQEWKSYLKQCSRVYKLTKPRVWWMYQWSQVVAQTNIALARQCRFTPLASQNVSITITDDITIAGYTQGSWSFTEQRFHPKDLQGFLRFPFDWWAENIDTVSKKLFDYGKAMVTT